MVYLQCKLLLSGAVCTYLGSGWYNRALMLIKFYEIINAMNVLILKNIFKWTRDYEW